MDRAMPQSAFSYFADMVLSPLLALGLSIFALTHFSGLKLIEWFLAIAAGAALWTLCEYFVHRVVYHRIVVFKRLHEAHHADPRAYIGAPPMLATGIVFLGSFAPLAAIAPIFANGLSVGMLLGYATYALTHHAFHFWTPTPGGHLYRMRLHHAAHHYHNDEGNFGVTTSFWDRVFGTRIQRSGSFARG
jgi:sterol desaturase/sphingolipid hydroxylase (fatty acid hydroxylase superfamily)